MTAPEPTGNLETALAHTRRLLQIDPVMAVEQASEILKMIPGHPPALLLKGTAQRLSGDARAGVRPRGRRS
jgi:hypothetical protein